MAQNVGKNDNTTNVARIRIGQVGYTGNRGTVSLPIISLEEDQNTGLYSSAADVFNVTAAGVLVKDFRSTQDNVIWVPAASLPTIYFTTGTWTATRIAAGNYLMRHTDGDETSTIEYPLGSLLARSTASTGWEFSGLRYVYGIRVADMDAHTYDLLTATYADATAVSVATTLGGTLTGTLITAFAGTQPRATAITTGTDSFIADLQGSYFQVTANNATTSGYDAYGVFFDGRFV